MKTNKKAIQIVAILFFIIVLVCIFPIPRKIDKIVPAFEWQNGNANYQKQTQIKIKGIYKDYLFRRDTFKGTICIDGYDYTSDGTHELRPFTFFNNDAHLQYMDKKTFYFKSLGTIYRNPNWDKTLICVYKELEGRREWSEDDGIIISAPATTREEAMKVVDNIKQYDGWISRIKWK
ncbi:hypothetical protein RBG61_04700 [Paludicola sp. MB14-C6]|uniref:hypothetical protein n=1 Tax=Paludihabitans sp. MB14-C6 TaxID=3070656 RepID=UPI0027DCCE30|nr:hypothetical protein [Paludicola sp. MB14-C6]WMJ23973.1 hypothetical protein RBG61_04700 [Paludicola sp. MB14-C6]